MRKRASPRRDRREIDKTRWKVPLSLSLSFLLVPWHSRRGRLIGSVEPIPREIINGCYVKKMMERFMGDAESAKWYMCAGWFIIAYFERCTDITKEYHNERKGKFKGVSWKIEIAIFKTIEITILFTYFCLNYNNRNDRETDREAKKNFQNIQNGRWILFSFRFSFRFPWN